MIGQFSRLDAAKELIGTLLDVFEDELTQLIDDRQCVQVAFALGIAPGETTPDGRVSLLTARCLGSCGLAPAVVYDQEVAGKVAVSGLVERVAQWKRHES